MSDIKIGDRVRHLVDSFSVPYGTEGTVVPPDEDSLWSELHVLWDEYQGHMFTADYVWASEYDEVEKVTP